MKQEPSNNLYDLINESLQGDISPQRFALLDQYLNSEEDLFDEYFDMVMIHSALKRKGSQYFSNESQTDPNLDIEKVYREIITKNELDATAQTAMNQLSQKLKIKKLAEEQLSNFLKQDTSNPLKVERTYLATSALSNKTLLRVILSSAACLIVGCGVWFLLNKLAYQNVAKITDQYQAIWRMEPASSLENKTYTLKSGLAEIEFNDGAKIILEGPSEITFESANGAYLKHGKLVAHVPQQAHGFTINTNSAQIIDIGTSFGLLVNQEQTSTVAVFEGKVSIIAGNNGENMMIKAGQIKQVAYGNQMVTDIDSQESNILFTKSIHHMDQKHFDDKHGCLKTNTGNNLYFTMDNTLAMGDINQHGIQYVLTDRNEQSQTNDHSAFFHQKNSRIELSIRDDYVDVDVLKNRMTLAFWLKREENKDQIIVDNQGFKIFITQNDYNDGLLKVFYSLKHANDNIADEHKYLSHTKPSVSSEWYLDIDEWYHIAVTFDSQQISLYVDGTKRTSEIFDADVRINSDIIEKVSLGSIDTNSGILSLGDFIIDDLIYSRTILSESEIKCLAEH